MYRQHTRRKRLAVHTGEGNETFCRKGFFCRKSFFVPNMQELGLERIFCICRNVKANTPSHKKALRRVTAGVLEESHRNRAACGHSLYEADAAACGSGYAWFCRSGQYW